MIATASGICVCVYHVALRISRLEQRVEVMSHRCGSSVKQLTATSTPIADRRHQTSGVSTTSSAPSTTSFARTSSSPMIDESGAMDDNYEDRQTYDNSQVVGELQDDDEDTEEFSGDGSSGDNPHKFIDSWSQFSSYDHYHTGRRKRSVHDLSMSVAAPGSARGRRPHQQQQQHHGRRRTGHRTTSNPADSSRQNPRTPGDERRRDRKRQSRRRPRTHTDVVDGQLAHV